MDERDSTQSLLALRKLTRAIADIVRAQMTEYLAAFAPLLRPKIVLGDYVEDGSKESTRRSEKAFKELQALYEAVSAAKPFNIFEGADTSAPARRDGRRDHTGRHGARHTAGIRLADDHGALAPHVDADVCGVCADQAAGIAQGEAADRRPRCSGAPAPPTPCSATRISTSRGGELDRLRRTRYDLPENALPGPSALRRRSLRR